MISTADLLEDIYDGILEPSPWGRFLEKVGRLTNSVAVTLVLRAPSFGDEGVYLGYGIVPKYTQLFRKVYFRYSPFALYPRYEPVTIDELVPREQLLQSDFYRKFLRPGSTEYILGTTLRIDPESSCLWTLSRTREAGNFSPLEKALVRELSPHLSRAIKLYINRQLSELKQTVFADSLDQLKIGVIVLDQSLRVLCSNQSAQAVAGDNETLDLNVGTPLLPAGMKQQKLRRLLQDVLNAYLTHDHDYCQALKLSDPLSADGIDLLAKPASVYPIVQSTPAPAISIYIQRPGPVSMPPPAVVRKLFGLTNMEASIVTLISSGLTVDQVAAQLGLKANTVRVHLRAAFAKTRVSRQSVLVSHVLRSIAMLAT